MLESAAMATRALGHAKPRLTAALMIAMAAYAGAAMTFLVQLILARGLGAEDFGVFATALASVNMLAPLATFGLSGLLLRVFGEDHTGADEWVRPVLKTSVIASVVIIIAWCCWGLLQGSSTVLIAAFALYLVGQVAIDFDVIASQLRDRHARVALLQFCPPVLRLIAAGCALFVFGWFGPDAAALSFGLVGLLHAAAAAPVIMRLAAGRREPGSMERAPSPSIGRVVANAGPFGLIAFLYMTYSQVPIVVANHVEGAAAAGQYSVIMVIISAAYLLPSAVTQKFLLRKVHVWLVHDKPKIIRLYRYMLPWSLVGGGLVAGVLAAIAPFLIPTLFGQELATDPRPLFVLLLGLPFRFASISMSVLLVGRKGINWQIACLLLAAGSNIVLGLALGSQFGLVGIGLGVLITEIILFLSSWVAIRQSVIRDVGSEGQ
jgi:O-antigen/teichoic acid export membrane protein